MSRWLQGAERRADTARSCSRGTGEPGGQKLPLGSQANKLASNTLDFRGIGCVYDGESADAFKVAQLVPSSCYTDVMLLFGSPVFSSVRRRACLKV